MISDDENAFLESIKGTFPIKKNNRLEKEAPLVKIVKKEKPTTENISINKQQHRLKTNTTKKVSFSFESTPLNKKLKKGKIPIDKKIDFHGMTLFEAETLFFKTTT